MLKSDFESLVWNSNYFIAKFSFLVVLDDVMWNLHFLQYKNRILQRNTSWICPVKYCLRSREVRYGNISLLMKSRSRTSMTLFAEYGMDFVVFIMRILSVSSVMFKSNFLRIFLKPFWHMEFGKADFGVAFEIALPLQSTAVYVEFMVRFSKSPNRKLMFLQIPNCPR